MKLGIVPMSAKPFHSGHNSLIRFAAGIELLDQLVELGYAKQENDKVNVYVSYSSRGVKKRTRKGVKFEVPIEGEAPVFGKDMEYIWNDILTSDNLGYSGTNVSIITPRESGIPSPVKAGFDIAGAFKEAKEDGLSQWTDPISGDIYDTEKTIITFYCGEDDLNRYNNDTMTRYYGDLYVNGLINVVGIPRVVSISGTQMRQYLINGDIESLKQMLPSGLSEENKEKIATTLIKSVELGRPSSQEDFISESLIRRYVTHFIS